ncbi:uncharacterized protein LOC107433685 [Ziziphus jujuba]|uniref:Uncharacterized protein LOC107433685 n=2 Tax=Ziziphus jujuba TaxID=326968 RepID=A0A6P4APX8_ZIZJJ|nr:uncharacterized protein LOC107433685 [Ziziphus jujuba]
MIKTLNPYSNTAKTAEIMSRYRPIAPKPEQPTNPSDDNSSVSQKIRESPYLRNLWPQLQARPTRTRKRGRAAISPPTLKRQRSHVLGLSPPCHVTASANNLSLQGFARRRPQLPIPNSVAEATAPTSNLVTLPLLPPNSVPIGANQAVLQELDLLKPCREENLLDLNTSFAEIPEEKDLLGKLQESPSTNTFNVIAPQPVRPVGSSIRVGRISEDPNLALATKGCRPKKPEEVEEEVESESLPVVISDSNNKVRMVNSAYKEMVGQPECSWLDSMVNSSDGKVGGSSCKRISGEVVLQLCDSRMPISSNGFSCWVRIEWGSERNKNSVNAFCDVIRLSCESKDYLFTWRFHTHTREASQSSCNI